MANNIKLIAIDLDGTLLTDDKTIPQANIAAIEEAMAQDIKVVICTGRTWPGVERFVEQLPFPHSKDEEYLILQNGAVTYRLSDLKMMQEYTLASSAIQQLVDFIPTYETEGARLLAFDHDKMYLIGGQEPTDLVIEDAKTLATEITHISFEEFVKIKRIYKMMIMSEQTVLDKIQSELPETLASNSSVVRSQPIIIEFLPKDINKGVALKALSNQLNISADNIMALGDQLNDYEMLEYVGLGVKMGNGVDGLDAIVDATTATNNEAGVAQAINKYIF